MENNLEINDTVAEKPENLANDKIQPSQPTAATPKSDRIGRGRFFIWSCLFLPMCIVLQVEFAKVTEAGFATAGQIIYAVLLNSLLVVATLFYIWAAIKRLHDMNMSGWWSLLYFLQGQAPILLLFFLIPKSSDFYWHELPVLPPVLLFASLYLWFLFPVFNIALCCIKGTNGANKYGAVPN